MKCIFPSLSLSCIHAKVGHTTTTHPPGSRYKTVAEQQQQPNGKQVKLVNCCKRENEEQQNTDLDFS